MAFEAREPAPEDIHELAIRMRAADREEVFLSGRHTPEGAVRHSLRHSRWSFAIRVNGDLVCIFGLAGFPGLRVRSPWLLGTPSVATHGLTVARYSKRVVTEMRKGVDRLENYVHDDNIISQRWLRWCGFRIHDPAPYGPFGALFRRFEIKGLPDV